MSDTQTPVGSVTISLEQYEKMKIREAELQAEITGLKTNLEIEKHRTWLMFGKFFESPRKLTEVYDGIALQKQYRITVKQPTTIVQFDCHEDGLNWNKDLIYRTLIERHILDVVNAVGIALENKEKVA